MSKASILASGYITYPNENLITKPLDENIYIKYVIVRDYLKNHSSYFYSEEIEYLYRLANQNDNSINDMDNRIRVIQLAKMLFNDSSILDWVELQKHNPLISVFHIDFIKDTLGYIFRGTRHRMDMGSYIRLLEPNVANKDNIVNLTKYLDEVLSEYSDFRPISLGTTITIWMAQPNGYIDLINTLYILYGPRDKVFTIA
jgi:hypothetical protein